MGAVVLSWVYMFLICVLIGVGALRLVRNRQFAVTLYLAAGIV